MNVFGSLTMDALPPNYGYEDSMGDPTRWGTKEGVPAASSVTPPSNPSSDLGAPSSTDVSDLAAIFLDRDQYAGDYDGWFSDFKERRAERKDAKAIEDATASGSVYTDSEDSDDSDGGEGWFSIFTEKSAERREARKERRGDRKEKREAKREAGDTFWQNLFGGKGEEEEDEGGGVKGLTFTPSKHSGKRRARNIGAGIGAAASQLLPLLPMLSGLLGGGITPLEPLPDKQRVGEDTPPETPWGLIIGGVAAVGLLGGVIYFVVKKEE
jgi:hypothetical protein